MNTQKNNTIKHIVFGLIIWTSPLLVLSQQTALTRLETFYGQGHYKKAYRYAGKLLNNPEWDETPHPVFFRALSAFRLATDPRWTKKHPNTLSEASDLYSKFLSIDTQTDNQQWLQHLNDLIVDLTEISKQLNKAENDAYIQQIARFLSTVTNELDLFTSKHETNTKHANTLNIDTRDEIVKFANMQLNAPYLYGGSSPKGFDCSGFVNYVFNAYHITLPRRSHDQYINATKIDKSSVQKGDLVFFDSGKGVNHVGIVVSERGEPITMIHASTTSGITQTNIESSSYWMQRIKGYGTFLIQQK